MPLEITKKLNNKGEETKFEVEVDKARRLRPYTEGGTRTIKLR